MGVLPKKTFAFARSKISQQKKDAARDKAQFSNTMRAMSDMGMTPLEQNSVLETTAALLHLRNVEFENVASALDTHLAIDNLAGTPRGIGTCLYWSNDHRGFGLCKGNV